MDELFFNTYIETLNKRIEEDTKQNIILLTKLTVSEKIIESLKKEIEEKEASISNLNEKLEAANTVKKDRSQVKG